MRFCFAPPKFASATLRQTSDMPETLSEILLFYKMFLESVNQTQTIKGGVNYGLSKQATNQ